MKEKSCESAKWHQISIRRGLYGRDVLTRSVKKIFWPIIDGAGGDERAVWDRNLGEESVESGKDGEERFGEGDLKIN